MIITVLSSISRPFKYNVRAAKVSFPDLRIIINSNHKLKEF